MARVGKKYTKAREITAVKPQYPLNEAVSAVTKAAFAKFDETVEVAMRLGVDPKHADQMVRGTVILPHGLGGKSKRVLVVASGEKLKEAQDAGADFVGGDDMVTKIQTENWLDYDAVVATPDMMKSVGKLTMKQVEEIAKQKLPDLNASDLKAAMNTVMGTARSMGVDIG